MSDRGDHGRWAGGEQEWQPEQGAWPPVTSRDRRDAHGGYAGPRDVEQGRGEWAPQPPGPSWPAPPSARQREQREQYDGREAYGEARDEPRPRPRIGTGPGRKPRPQPQVRRAVLSPLLLVVLPLFGALVSGSGLGIVFAIACVVAALGAALLCSSNGLWWIVPSTPTALLAVAFGWATIHGLNSAKTTVAAATSVFQSIAGAFPGIAAGTVAALVVAGVRVSRGAAERRGKRG